MPLDHANSKLPFQISNKLLDLALRERHKVLKQQHYSLIILANVLANTQVCHWSTMMFEQIQFCGAPKVYAK